jgi:hypothetical protein
LGGIKNSNDGREIMKLFKLTLQTVLFMAAVFGFQIASACSFDAWFTFSGSVLPDDPNGSTNATPTPRVGGFCAMAASGTGYVEDRSPTDDGSFIGRFYFLSNFTPAQTGAPPPSPPDIFVAYSTDTPGVESELFSVIYDNGNVTIDATAATGGASGPIALLPGWNLIEFEWVADTTGNIWVNANAAAGDPATDTFAPGSGAVNSVRLGLPNGIGNQSGSGKFDDYQSQRSEAVGPHVLTNGESKLGDSNDDDSVDAGDINAVVNEFLFQTLGPGVADCNLDASVDAGDINCIVNDFLNL